MTTTAMTTTAMTTTARTTTVLAGTSVELDQEGYLVEPTAWTEELATELAAADGIAELSPAHWQVIRVMRDEWRAHGSGPAVRALSKISGLSIKDLYVLFPKGPAKVAARIAGIPKPRGCI